MNSKLPDFSKLEKYRLETDPLADDLVKNIFAKNEGKFVSELFDQLITNADYQTANLPKEIYDYFDATHELPEWADLKKVEIGQQVFREFGPAICLLLLCKSLPEAYACKKGAQVMYHTGRMMESKDGSLSRFTRRLMETSQFVINICTSDSFAPKGSGLVTAQKVRLIHATIRHFIHKSGHWDTAVYGEPINQEDMAGTLQSFSSLILEGLEQLGVSLTPVQIDGYFHCWRVAGHFIGLKPELNPETYADGLKLGYAILDQQKAPSKAGVELTKAVIDFMEHAMPGNLFNHAPAALIRYFVGDKTADMLAVSDKNKLSGLIVPKLTGVVFHEGEKLDDHHAVFRKLSEAVSHHFLQGMLNYFDHYKGVHFYLPPSLKGDWKLHMEWERYKALSPGIFGYRLALEKRKSTL